MSAGWLDPHGRWSRRQLLQTGGLGAALGVLLVACGDDGESAPGRVGFAPPATPLPDVEVNDVVWLRTAMSIEQTLLDIYARAAEMGALSGPQQEMVDRFVQDHTEHSEALAALITAAGGEPYDCPNQWYLARTVDPILAAVADSDDPTRDLLAVSNAFESMAASMYQQMVESLLDPELRRDTVAIGASEARHAAAIAMAATGVPDGYVSPELMGEEISTDESGLFPVYAIPGRFGSLAAVDLVVGARSEAGTRQRFVVETPAANSLIYEGMVCEA